MLQGEFYHELMRKYVVLFGTLFNDINLTRYDADGSKAQQLKVPLSYGPKEKYLARLDEDATIDRQKAITLPRISFEISSITYDGTRKRNSLNKIVSSDTSTQSGSRVTMWNPVPYNIVFTLTVMTRNTEDGAKIVEQILPNFTPDWTISAKLIDDIDNFILDIPVYLNDVSSEDLYTGDFVTRRATTWNLNFTMKAQFAGPVKKSKVIKVAKANLYDSLTANSTAEIITVKPGLTVNGDPTTFNSNSVSQATATATVEANTVTVINVDTSGIGYSNATITIDPPSDNTGVTAQATAIIKENTVAAIKMINNGSKYSTPPTVTISPPDMATVAYTEIEAEDDFGFVVTIESVDDV